METKGDRVVNKDTVYTIQIQCEAPKALASNELAVLKNMIEDTVDYLENFGYTRKALYKGLPGEEC